MTAETPWTFSQARTEACRCLQCFDPPCTKACPAGIVIPRFIRMIRSRNIRGAAEVVRSSNPMAASCGLACPDEQLCASVCVRAEIDRPVEIRRLHRHVTEWEDGQGARARQIAAAGPARVAVVGAGPAGLACAFELRRLGVQVTLLEMRGRAGGVLSRTIPLYRFPERAVRDDLSWILQTGDGIDLQLGVRVEDVEELARRFDAVFVATGLRGSGRADLPGTDLEGVLGAEEFLADCRERGYKNPIGSEVVVLGGGNVAIDAAMAALRCGEAGSRTVRVQVLYRRTRLQMPAWQRETAEAEASGVVFQFLLLPESFEGKEGKLAGVRLCRARLGADDASGRPVPVPIPGSSFVIPCDQAILAIGQELDRGPLGRLSITGDGLLQVDPETGRVRDNIFAGGDAAGEDQTIVAAVRDGKRAARAIAALPGVRGR